MSRATLESRRERVARINARRPTVRAVYRPKPTTMDELADLLLELLDVDGHSR